MHFIQVEKKQAINFDNVNTIVKDERTNNINVFLANGIKIELKHATTTERDAAFDVLLAKLSEANKV